MKQLVENKTNFTPSENIVVSVIDTQSDLPSPFNAIVDYINLMKNSIRNQIETYFLTVYLIRKREVECHHYPTKKEYEKSLSNLASRFEEISERINRVFSEFQLVSIDMVIYGSQKYLNYMVCQYGSGDRYKNAFWIHINALKELISNIPEEMPVHKDITEYLTLLENAKKMAAEMA